MHGSLHKSDAEIKKVTFGLFRVLPNAVWKGGRPVPVSHRLATVLTQCHVAQNISVLEAVDALRGDTPFSEHLLSGLRVHMRLPRGAASKARGGRWLRNALRRCE